MYRQQEPASARLAIPHRADRCRQHAGGAEPAPDEDQDRRPGAVHSGGPAWSSSSHGWPASSSPATASRSSPPAPKTSAPCTQSSACPPAAGNRTVRRARPARRGQAESAAQAPGQLPCQLSAGHRVLHVVGTKPEPGSHQRRVSGQRSGPPWPPPDRGRFRPTRARHRLTQHDTEPNATAGLHHAAGLITIGECQRCGVRARWVAALTLFWQAMQQKRRVPLREVST